VEWSRSGALLLSPGATIDYDHIARFLRDRVFAEFDVQKVGYDPYNWSFMRAALLRAGITQQYIDDHFVPVRQGFLTMGELVSALEGMLLDKKVAHGGAPVLEMCAQQAIVLRDNSGNRKLDKDGYLGRIDTLIALVIAIGVMPMQDHVVNFDDILFAITGEEQNAEGDQPRRVH
jgi:phage terminase large subunit-like protein